MNVSEAAEYLGLSKNTVYLLCTAKKIRHRRTGPNRGRIHITREWCDEYLAAGEIAPVGETARSVPTTPPPRRETIKLTASDRAVLDEYRQKRAKRQGAK